MVVKSMASATDPDMRSAEASPSSPMSRHTPIVFVVGDNSVRNLLEWQIRSSGWQLEAFPTAERFLSRAPVYSPNCLVLDVTLPGFKGIDFQERVAANHIDMPMILTSGNGNVLMMVQATRAGGVELLSRPFGDNSLLSSIRLGLERSETTRRSEAELRALGERYSALSRREMEVMTLVVTGLLNKQVGFELGISEITVKAHRGRVMQKMNAKSLVDLVNIAAKLGIPTRHASPLQNMEPVASSPRERPHSAGNNSVSYC